MANILNPKLNIRNGQAFLNAFKKQLSMKNPKSRNFTPQFVSLTCFTLTKPGAKR
jgi:hypothetical protein